MEACRVKLVYPAERVRDPVVATLVRDYGVMPNIRRARVSDDAGELVLEIDGEHNKLQRALEYLRSLGIVVEPVEGEYLES